MRLGSTVSATRHQDVFENLPFGPAIWRKSIRRLVVADSPPNKNGGTSASIFAFGMPMVVAFRMTSANSERNQSH